jgi:N-acetylmuramic acid 6-phosphate etherase
VTHGLPGTEAANPATRDLDLMETSELVAVLNHEQELAASAVLRATPAIGRAVDAIVARLRRGGRLHYVGAGTSGRIAMLDAAECPPTFGTAPSLVVAHVAGGEEALVRAVEGAEDDAPAGSEMVRASVDGADAVVGISASGGAGYVVAALRTARELGALTVAVTSVEGSALAEIAEYSIAIDTGAEPIAGSTRLKGGTAAKLVLNALSTATMVRLGRVHDNLMVDVVATNVKLHARAIRLVKQLGPVDADAAGALLERSGGNVKVAVVMHRRGVGPSEARALLEGSGGFLRPLL